MARRTTVVTVPYSDSSGLPCGQNIFYLCLLCRTVVPSLPEGTMHCMCRNISIDPDAGRGGARDLNAVVVLSVNAG
jgi:hypothetical protein